MRAIAIYTPSDKKIVLVQDVPGEVISVNQSKSFMIDETESLKTALTSLGYDVSKIEEYENQIL